MPIYAEIEKRAISIGGEPHQGWIPENASTPPETPRKTFICHFQIADDGGEGFLLIYGSEDGTYCGDTWHESLDDAVVAAQEEFNITREEWSFSTRDVG